jgi:hypothetical protein
MATWNPSKVFIKGQVQGRARLQMQKYMGAQASAGQLRLAQKMPFLKQIYCQAILEESGEAPISPG